MTPQIGDLWMFQGRYLILVCDIIDPEYNGYGSYNLTLGRPVVSYFYSEFPDEWRLLA